MNRKGSIELSINMLVVIIISLVILSGGILLLYKFMGGAEEIKTTLDQKTNQELERLLITQGKKVALPLNTVSLERGESHVFGLGIMNIGDKSEFTIDVSLPKFIDEKGEESNDNLNAESWLLYDPGPFNLEENENRKEEMLVVIPMDALKGQYIFNVQVKNNGVDYDSVKKVVVNVK